jgi:hypothetical protein
LNKNILSIALAFATAFAAAATNGSETAKPGNISPKPETVLQSIHPVAIAADAKHANVGKVVEVIDSPMYTFLKVTGEKGPLWLASYKTDITKGATVKYTGGVAMPNFYSKALNRTFDVIVFVDSLELVME